MKTRAIQYWRSLQPRERLVLGCGGGLLALMLLYAMVWQPVLDQRNRLARQIPVLQHDLATIRGLVPEAAGGAAAGGGQSLQSIVSAAVAAAGLQATSITQPDPKHLQLHFDHVAFQDWLTLLASVQMRHGLQLVHADVTRLTEPGFVSAQAELSR